MSWVVVVVVVLTMTATASVYRKVIHGYRANRALGLRYGRERQELERGRAEGEVSGRDKLDRTREELRQAYERIARMEQDLASTREELRDYRARVADLTQANHTIVRERDAAFVRMRDAVARESDGG